MKEPSGSRDRTCIATSLQQQENNAEQRTAGSGLAGDSANQRSLQAVASCAVAGLNQLALTARLCVQELADSKDIAKKSPDFCASSRF
jgi:hypothetical protein